VPVILEDEMNELNEWKRDDPMSEIRKALPEDSEEAEFLTYPIQDSMFWPDFVRCRSIARSVFRASGASPKEVRRFIAILRPDDEFSEKARLVRHLCDMRISDADRPFRDFVDHAHREAIEYAESVLARPCVDLTNDVKIP